jgi:predicted Zn-dependent protease
MRQPTDRSTHRAARRPSRALALALVGLSLLAACVRAPVTDRLQVNAIPEKVMLPLGSQTYAEMLSGRTVVKGDDRDQTLQRVGKRISKAAGRPDYKWRYALVDEPQTINAWCLPGGKIAFYTGILPVVKNEAGMAFVMGHEVAHATAHHGAERMTQQLALLGGLGALYLYIDQKTDLSQKQMNAVIGALGLGAEVGFVLPFSRKHEREADIIGLMYMSRAGYPPEESIAVWKRMARKGGGSDVPPWLSTHPSHEQRQANLREWMGQAQARYARNRLAEDTLQARWR